MKEEIHDCSSCNSGWQIKIGKESYCGWCGTAVQGFKLTCSSKKENLLIYADEQQSYNLEFHVENTGFIPITIDQIDLR